MWPTTSGLPIEDYEYAVTGAGEGVYAATAPRVLHIGPAMLASVVAGAFALGLAAGWGLAQLIDD